MEAVFEELNYPSAVRLKRVLKDRGIPFDPKEVDKLVKGESTRQVQAPNPLFRGKIWSTDLNDRWFADLVDFTAAPSDGGKKTKLEPTEAGEKYILVVQDVFSRRIWARSLYDKQPETVAEAFDDILQKSKVKPRSLTTDGGAEFGGIFKIFVEREGIIVHTKDKYEPNVIATLDIAIGYLKKALVRVARKGRTDDWADILQKVVDGQNKLPNDTYLEGKAPASVPNDPAQIEKLKEKNVEYIKTNEALREARRVKLEEAGSFRVLIPRAQHFSRGFKPRWSQEVHRVANVDGHVVTDEKGEQHKTKFAQAVADSTNDAGPVRMERGGSEQTSRKQRSILSDLANDVIDKFKEGSTISLARIGVFLNTRGFRNLALEARINMKAPVKNFLNLFPQKFSVHVQGGLSFARIKNPVIAGLTRLRRISAS